MIKADEPAQSQRFVNVARELEADEGPDAMDLAFRRVISPPKLSEPKKDD